MMKDLLQFSSHEHKVKILNREISAFRSKSITRSGAREFTNQNTILTASQIGEVNSDQLFAACAQNQAAALPAEGKPTGQQKQSWKHTSNDESGMADQALTAARDAIALLAKELPHFQISGQTMATTRSARYTNTKGADLVVEHNDYLLMTEFRRLGSPNIVDSFSASSNVSGFQIADDLSWTMELLKTYDQVIEIKPGRHRIMTVPDHRSLEKIGESLRADRYHEGTALYSGRQGQKIFSSKFSLSDLRWDPARSTLNPFDFEGTVAQTNSLSLITEGRLNGLISDLVNENRHGVKSTGNGFRGYNSSVKLGFSQLAVEPGKRSFREILKDAGEVIFTVMAFGGDLTAQGDFATPVQLAFLVRDGVVLGRIASASLNSHIERMYGNQLLEVAADAPTRGESSPLVLMEMDVQ